MVCPVEMFQSGYEFNPLLEQYKTLKARNVVEIGSLFGGTLWHWLQSIEPGGKVSVVDMLVSPADGRYQQQYQCHNTLWYEWAKAANTNLWVSEQASNSKFVIDAIHERYRNDPVDFMFIDGDHHYESVKNDFENYIDLVRPGGIVGFHDIAIPMDHPHYGGVKKFWEELKTQYKTEEYIEIPNWWGVGILHV